MSALPRWTRSCLPGDPHRPRPRIRRGPAFAVAPHSLWTRSRMPTPLAILASGRDCRTTARSTTYFMLWIIESTLVAPSAGLDLPKSTSVATGVNSLLKPEALGGVT